MRIYSSILTVGIIFAQNCIADCPCPKKWGATAGKPSTLIVFDNNNVPALVVCRNDVYKCGEHRPILSYGSTDSCSVVSVPGKLSIIEYSRWPFGKDWKWFEVPIWELTILVDSTIAKTKRMALIPPTLSSNQIDEAIRQYNECKKFGSVGEDYENLIGKILAVALSNNKYIIEELPGMRKELHLDGHSSEMYSEALEIYQAYAKETGKVPILENVVIHPQLETNNR